MLFPYRLTHDAAPDPIGRCRRSPRRRPLLWLVGTGGVVATTLLILWADTASIAAPPGMPFSGKRLFDAFTKKPTPPQAFITAPTPPPAPAEDEPAGKAADAPTPKPAESSPESVGPVRQPRIGILPQQSPAAPPRVPTWDETMSFAKSLKISADRVAAAAVNPAYSPKPQPQRAPITKANGRTTGKASPSAQASPQVNSSTNSTTNSAKASSSTVRQQAAAKMPQSRQGTGPQPPQTKRLTRLRSLIDDTLATYQRRPLNTAANTPWEVMHGFIAFGIPTQVRVGGPTGDLVNAIGWMNMGGRCRGQVMLATAGDRLVAQKGIGVQGHSAQYLAILAQCRVALNSPIAVQSKSFTVADLVEEEKLSCKSNTELTFALIGLAHYLPTEAEWKSRDGKSWDLEKLVAEEIEQPIRGAPCGGTHRLFGLAYGCQRRLRATGRLDGHYARADKYVRDYQAFALTKLQNPDGSFSTEWFKYPADRPDDIDRKVQTTGHILEWLVASLDQQDLYQPRIQAAVEFLATSLARQPSREWKIGPMGHALHALTIYQERVWGTVLPGGIAAFHGPMKAAPDRSQMATKPEDGPLVPDQQRHKQIRR